jgi:conjugal transfer pilus assembly protein TraE
MDTIRRGATISGLERLVNYLLYSVAGLSTALLIAMICLATQSKTVLMMIPGMPSGTEIKKSSMDIGAQRALVMAVTSNIAQINPANAEYQKAFLQAFLSPQQYTKLSAEIDAKARLLAEQRELGSYYFVFRRHEYDEKINRHFVIGDVHTVNAAKDTSEPWVFDYQMHVENYRPVIDDVLSYRGDKAHNFAWLEVQKR